MLMTYTQKKLLSSLALSYCLPLVRIVLEERGIRIKGDERLRQEMLQLILLHSKRKSMIDFNLDEQVWFHLLSCSSCELCFCVCALSSLQHVSLCLSLRFSFYVFYL